MSAILSDKRVSDCLSRTNNDFGSSYTLYDSFSREGLQTLGVGADAAAIEYEGRCYKFITTPSYGYHKFLEVIKNIDSIHLPKIYSVEKFGPITIVEMELLKPLDPTKYNCPREGIIERERASEDFCALVDLLYGITLEDHKLIWDLHSENAMKREDGTPVIIDPFYG